MNKDKICKIFGHKWEDLAFNRWMIPTYRECKRCEKSQEQKHLPKYFGQYEWYGCKRKIKFKEDRK